jgi:t-SNARE complex subunit (syntaxin)
MEQTQKVQEQLKDLVVQQGNTLDIVEKNMDSARSNVREAGALLDDAVVQSTQANKKKCIIGIIIVICLLVILGPFIFFVVS